MGTAPRAAVASLLIVVATAALLLLMGRPPICTCGSVELWVGSADSPKTSQMLADWYSFSHVVHGFLFYAALWLLIRSRPPELRFVLALLIEAGWEVIENTPIIIEHYRQETMAIGYTGDSVLNSLSDVLMMALGFLVARRVPVWASVLIVIAIELAPLIAIRDNLTLNVWTFIAPTEALREWQSGR